MAWTLAPGISYVDVMFRNRPAVIAAGLLQDAEGLAIVDPGPASCLPALQRALADRGSTLADVHTLLITHIHLDHAGATGSIVREHPRVRVFVHERGARHLIDPMRFLDSARRLYGAELDVLFGDVLPVPEANVTALAGGETLVLGARRLEVAYTPGHAWHHVSFFDPASRIAFIGDAAGIRRGPVAFVLPTLAPPDIDLEAWETSIERILAWDPASIFLTHFGAFNDVRRHFSELRENLGVTLQLVRDIFDTPGTDEEHAALFAERLRRLMLQRMPAPEADGYAMAGPLEYNWFGMARYWSRRRTA